MANKLTRAAMDTRRMVQAGIPDNIIQQVSRIKQLEGSIVHQPGSFKLGNSYTTDSNMGKLIAAAQQCARSIIAAGGQAYGGSTRDVVKGNMTFSEFASLAKQHANGEWWISNIGLPYPVQSSVCEAYANSIANTGMFGLGRTGQDKKGAELDKALKNLDFTTLSDGTSAASGLNTVLKMCYEGIQNAPQDVSQKLNNALSIVAKNVQKDNQTPDKRYTAAFVNWCIQNSTSYTMAWLKQSFPNPAETFKSALTINGAQTANAAANAANTVKVK